MDISRERLEAGLREERYITTDRVATVLLLALRLEKPLLIEGPAGAGKTEVAKVLASFLGLELMRLQCYEGLDEGKALYEWNYQRQLLCIQAMSVEGKVGRSWEDVSHDIFSREFLLERPLLKAISSPKRVVLLVDEVDKADEEFEAFLLELLSDFQVSVPELGTLRASERPIVVLTSNRTRELSEALQRRCLYLWVDFPPAAKEKEILALKVPELSERLQEQVVRFVQGLRQLDLHKAPSIAETLDWARGLVALGIVELDAGALRETMGLLLKGEEDQRRAAGKITSLLGGSSARAARKPAGGPQES